MTQAITIPASVAFVLKTLQEAGFQAYIVGGAVRDLLTHKSAITDWDFTTNATPEQILNLFNESFYDNQFGTVMVAEEHVLTQSGIQAQPLDIDVFDITTYRTEVGYSNRRHPDQVSWGTSLEEDVKRRDFTINALALEIDLIKEIDKHHQTLEVEAVIIDYHHGLDHLQQAVIETVGDAQERFREDALRMMRAIRIAAQLSFHVSASTLAAIQANAPLIQEIATERIRVELFKILASDFPADGIIMLDAAGLLEYILPELIEAKGVAQGGRHKYDVWKHAIESLRECPSKDPLVRFATLLHDIGKPRTARPQGPRGVTFYGHEVVGARMGNAIADRLRLSKKDKNRLFILIRWHMFTYNPDMTDSAVRRFIRRVGIENINDMIMLRIGDRKGGGSKATSWRLRELQQRIGENLYEPLGVKDLVVDGADVMQTLEVKPGPVIGYILDQLFEEVMEDRLPNEKEPLITKIKELRPDFVKERTTTQELD